MHISDQSGFIEDEEGRDLADDASAREEAIVAARDVMVADLRTGHLDLTPFIEVKDADHNLLFTVQFSDVVTVTRP